MKSKKIQQHLERTDDYEELPSNQRPKGDSELFTLRNENSKLEFILSKYNFILNEYQLKYGNELFVELDKQITVEALESNNLSEFKKILVENVSLIKEYEKIILEKTKNLEFFNSELNRFQIDTGKLVDENKELREELEAVKEENNKMYKTLLQPGVESMQNQIGSNSMGNFSKSANNFKSEFQNNLDIYKVQNEQLLQTVERLKYDNENQKNYILDINEKYQKLNNEISQLSLDLENFSRENKELRNVHKFFEDKLKENNNQLLFHEKKKVEAENTEKLFKEQNVYLQNELTHYQELYEELESRKNAELAALMRDLSEMRNQIQDLKIKLTMSEDTLSDLKFESARFKQENQILKYDCDHLTKIIEDSNFAVKSITEKEKHLDNTIRTHKKKVEEANLEKEKSIIKQRLLEKQLMKMSEDYSKLLQEKQFQYENFIESNKTKFLQIIENKDTELNQLRGDTIQLKLERDKYYSEYTILKKEADKFGTTFREENDKYIKKYDEEAKLSLRTQNQLQDKLNIFVRKCEKLEHERNLLSNELDLMKTTNQNREILIEKINKNEDSLGKDYNKVKTQSETLLKENEFLEKEIERITQLYETKLKQIREQSELKVTVLENTMKYHKDQFNSTENKAFDMLKKQESVFNIS
jgi:chromosome segregation ATPase